MTNGNPWIAEFRVASRLTVRGTQERLHYKHPQRDYEAYVANRQGVTDDARLTLHILLNAGNLEEAEETTKEQADKFLDLLSFICGTPFKIADRVHVMDWSPGKEMREAIVYSASAPLNEPVDGLLVKSILDTASLLHAWGASPLMERALRWFATAVHSRYIEDQFQYFWFVLELIAEALIVPPVTDKCQTCRGDLFCRTCDKTSTHRPFARQRIEAVCRRRGVTEDDITLLFKIRNALLHGLDRNGVNKIIQEQKPNRDLSSAADFIGRVARDTIMDSLRENATAPARAQFLVPSTFVSKSVTFGVHMRLGTMGDPNDPRIEDIRLPTISFARGSMPDDGVEPG